MAYAKSRTSAYGRVEGNNGKTRDATCDLDRAEPVEYCEALLFDACDIGRAVVERRAEDEVVRGGSVGGPVAFDAASEFSAVAVEALVPVEGIAAAVVMPLWI